MFNPGQCACTDNKVNSGGDRCGQCGQVETGIPDEGDLVFVHPGLQLQTWVFSKRGDDETKDKSDADEDGRKDDLKMTTFRTNVYSTH